MEDQPDTPPESAVLMYLSTNPESTTSDIAKAVFSPDGKGELRNADRKVRYYLTEKYPHLVKKEDGSPDRYSVDDVEAGLGKIEIQTFTGGEITVGLGGVVLHPDSEGRLNVSVVGDAGFVEDDS